MLALISYFWVPNIEIRKRYRVRICYRPTAITSHDVIEFGAACYHAVLVGSQIQEYYRIAKVSHT